MRENYPRVASLLAVRKRAYPLPMPVRRRLHKYDVHELSLVMHPDTRRRALVLKAAGEGDADTLSAEQLEAVERLLQGREKIEKARLPVLDGVDDPSAQQGMLDQQSQRTMQAVARLVAPHRDQITMQDLIDLAQAIGLEPGGGMSDDGGMNMDANDNNPDSGLDYTDEGVDAGDGDPAMQGQQQGLSPIEAIPGGEMAGDDGEEEFGDAGDDDSMGGAEDEAQQAQADTADQAAAGAPPPQQRQGPPTPPTPPGNDQTGNADTSGDDGDDQSEEQDADAEDNPAGPDEEDQVQGDDGDAKSAGALSQALNLKVGPPKNVKGKHHAEAVGKAKDSYLQHLQKQGYNLKPTGKPPPGKTSKPPTPGKGKPPMAQNPVNKNSPRGGIDWKHFDPAQREELEPIFKSVAQARVENDRLTEDNKVLIEKHSKLEQRVKDMEAAAEHKVLVEKCSKFSHLTDHEGLAKVASHLSGDAREAYLAQLGAQNEHIEKINKSSGGGIFQELGSRTGGEGAMRTGGNDAQSELDKLVTERVNKSSGTDKELTEDQALVEVLKTSPGRQAYNKAERERAARAPHLISG